jgi:uncharacterized OsmC-like protein
MKAKWCNGLNITQLNDTVGMITEKPEIAAFQFRADNQWVQGAQNKAKIKSFYGAGEEDHSRTKTFEYSADEPSVLLGKDEYANPVEHLLAALSSCMTTSLVTHAASEACEIEECTSHFEGDLDVQGFLGLDPNIPKGYKEIRANFRVKTGASKEKIEEWIKYSPVYNMVSAGLPVKIMIEKV